MKSTQRKTRKQKMIEAAPKKVCEIAYWKMIASEEALAHDKTKIQLDKETKARMLTEIQVLQAKNRICDFKIKERENERDSALIDYNKCLKDIEDSLGHSLDGYAINPETLEVYKDAAKE